MQAGDYGTMERWILAITSTVVIEALVLPRCETKRCKKCHQKLPAACQLGLQVLIQLQISLTLNLTPYYKLQQFDMRVTITVRNRRILIMIMSAQEGSSALQIATSLQRNITSRQKIIQGRMLRSLASMAMTCTANASEQAGP